MRISIILLLINFCFTQASGLALYGVGEKIGNIDVSSIALGNSTFFSGNKYGITTSSPSTLWKSVLTQFTIHSGINYLNISSYPQQFQHNLTHFSLTFPVGNKKVFGFGLKPAFRTNKLEIEEDLQFIGADKSIHRKLILVSLLAFNIHFCLVINLIMKIAISMMLSLIVLLLVEQL